MRLRFGFPTRASQFVPLLSGRDGRVWGSGGPWGFRCDVPAPGRSPARPSVTFGAFLRRSRTRRLSPARDHHRFGPGTSRTSPQRGGLGSCLLNPIRPWSSCRLSRATVFLRFTVAGVAAYLGCPKIASPSVHLAGVHSQLRPLSPLAWLVVRSLRGGGCHRALARPAYVPTLPFLRLRRFSPPASYPACAGPRSWGSLRFRPLRLSLLLPSPLRGFHPSKLCSPPNAATFAHAMVAAVHQPHRCRCDSLNPFPSRSCSPRFHESERNLKGFLVLRSRTPPALLPAPMGLCSPGLANPMIV